MDAVISNSDITTLQKTNSFEYTLVLGIQNINSKSIIKWLFAFD